MQHDTRVTTQLTERVELIPPIFGHVNATVLSYTVLSSVPFTASGEKQIPPGTEENNSFFIQEC